MTSMVIATNVARLLKTGGFQHWPVGAMDATIGPVSSHIVVGLPSSMQFVASTKLRSFTNTVCVALVFRQF
jgi:hypothetical protein